MSHITAMDPTIEATWIPKVDRELAEKEQLQILYKPLDMRTEAKISDDQIQSFQKGRKSEYKYRISQADIRRLEETITGWKNFNYPANYPDTDKANKPVTFSRENIMMLPPETRLEFISFVTGRERTDAEDGDVD
jgi:hypothetical protein